MEDVGRALWLDERRKGIGGTDAAAILGVNRWTTPLQVWLHKRNEAAPRIETEPQWWGLACEPLIARRFVEKTGRKVWRPQHPDGRTRMIVHPEHACIIGSPDYFLFVEAGLDCKMARSDDGWGPPGSDEVPESYIIQAQHYMAITGFGLWYIAALIGGNDFRVYEIRASRELQDFIVATCVEWWERHIVGGERPPMDGDEETSRWLTYRFPSHGAKITRAPIEATAIAHDLWRARSAMAEAEAIRATRENSLKELIGENAGIEGDGWRATWKAPAARKVVDYELLSEHLFQRLYGVEKLIKEHKLDADGAAWVHETREDLKARFTEERPSSRRFLFSWAGGD